MPHPFQINEFDIDRIDRFPDQRIKGALNGATYTARIAIPGYARRIGDQYGHTGNGRATPLESTNFGFLCEFSEPVEIALYDSHNLLAKELRNLVKRFGPVSFRNAYLNEEQRAQGQRNIFANLTFHYDRGPKHLNRYSMFWRDPFDPVQKHPRKSTTLILPNAVAYMQSIREGAAEHEFRAQYELFRNDDVANLSGDILFEQKWDAPVGTGEISPFDNRTVMHASYYNGDPGYPIGVQYLF